MSLELKRELYKIYCEFENNNFDLRSISKIVEIVRQYRYDLNAKNAKILLAVPLSVLKSDVKLINENDWSKNRGNLFSENLHYYNEELNDELDDEQELVNNEFEFNWDFLDKSSAEMFKSRWKKTFSKKKFNLKDLYSYLDSIAFGFSEYQSGCDSLLASVEVTLREDVYLDDCSDFNECGELFSQEIMKVIKKL